MSTSTSGEPKLKRRKVEMTDESSASTPLLTVARPGNMVVVHNFLMAVRCWDLLHSSESLERGNWYEREELLPNGPYFWLALSFGPDSRFYQWTKTGCSL